MRYFSATLRHAQRGWVLLGLLAVAVAAGVGVGALVWAGSTKAADKRPAAPAHLRIKTQQKGISKLFVVDGGAGSAVRSSTDTWRLTVKAVSVLWFADRPTPDSATQSAASLAAEWKQLFTGRPPFGAVLAPSGPAGHHPTAVQITDPSWNAATQTFSVTLKPDKGESLADADWLNKLTPKGEGSNGRVIVFVDGSSFTQTFSVDASPSYAFTPNPGASQCATPYAISPAGMYLGGTDYELYNGSTAVSDAGWCDLEVSEAIWDVTYNGYADGQLELDFSDGTYSPSCTEETCVFNDGDVAVGG